MADNEPDGNIDTKPDATNGQAVNGGKSSDLTSPLSCSVATDELPGPPNSAIFIPKTGHSQAYSEDPSVNADSGTITQDAQIEADFFLDQDDPFMHDVQKFANEYAQHILSDSEMQDPNIGTRDSHVSDEQHREHKNVVPEQSVGQNTETQNYPRHDIDAIGPIDNEKPTKDSDEVEMVDAPQPSTSRGRNTGRKKAAATGVRKKARGSTTKRPDPISSPCVKSSLASQPGIGPDSSAMHKSLNEFFEKHRLETIKRRSDAAAADNVRDRLPSYGIAPNLDDRDEEDFEDDEAAARFRRIRHAFEQKKAMGTLSLKEEIQFRRMAQEEARRQANLQNAVHEEQPQQAEEDGLFEPDPSGNATFLYALRKRQRHYADEDSIEGPSSKKHKSKSVSRGGSKDKSGSRAKTNGNGKTKVSAAEKKQQRAEGNLFNADSLGRQQLFQDVQTNTARAEQPTFSATNKQDAFKELIASIPEEARNTARMDKKQLEAATKKFTGKGSCRPLDSEWRVKGMKSSLTNYQMLGVSAMRERETTPGSSPAGGLHADAMGLGKTVMAITNIINDRYQQLKNAKGKTLPPTLIVAPSSIIPQWKEECEKHAEADTLGKVNIHKPVQEDDAQYPNNFGIILTSYQQVMKSYPKQDPPVYLTTAEEKKTWWEEHFDKYKGFFHRRQWRRVVLDEATAIKNHHSQTAIACAELEAPFRWALTGTPAMNALDEFYSYFRFLRVRNVGSFHLFKKNFLSADNDDVQTGKERLIAFMRPFMIRRTHNDSLLGAKLLNLPTPSRGTFTCHFSDLHAQLYTVVQKRFIEKINIISKAGELRKQYTCILTLLLRLRQLTGHPLLIQDTMRDLLEPEDFDKIHEILANAEKDGDTSSDQALIIVHLRRMMVEKDHLAQLDAAGSQERNSQPSQVDTVAASATPGDATASPETTNRSNTGSAWGTRDDFVGFIDDMRESSEKCKRQETRATCVRCKQEAQTVIMTSCNHTYCRECTFDDTRDAIAAQAQANTCAACGRFYSTLQTYEVERVAEASVKKAGAPAATAAANKGAGGFLKPSGSVCKPEPARVKIGEVLNTWLTSDKKMLPSAKTLAVKAQLLNWFAEDASVKVIIYTQFNTMIDILAKICHLEGWKALKYNGSMSAQNRARQVKKFESEADCRILIASLRCGGLGLNLTMATRVLLVDPWWNAAVEEQAFCRTYRRGQTQETRMSRLVVHNTVDEHMIRLQERKIGEIESVMGEESRNKHLPIDTLLELFGEVGEDEQGNRFIYTESDEFARGPRRNYLPGEDDEIVMGDSL